MPVWGQCKGEVGKLARRGILVYRVIHNGFLKKIYFYLFSFFALLIIEPRASYMLGRM